MMVILTLTLREAAETLGLQPGASTADVNASYRKLVAKYHPDANRMKSPAEQKQAEMMFKKVGEAKKVMLKPETAAPDPVSSAVGSNASASGTGASQRAGAYRSSVPIGDSRGRRNTGKSAASQSPSYQSSAASSQFSPNGYNTSTTFQSNIPKVPDPAEESLAQIHRNEARKDYRKFSDKVRITPSLIVTLAFLIYSIFALVTSPSEVSALSLSNPNIVMAGVCLIKAIYDVFVSYYVHEKLFKKLSVGWLAQCGIGTVIMGIGYLVISNAAKNANDVSDVAVNVTNIVSDGKVAGVVATTPETMLIMGIAILVGVAMCAINIFIRKKNEKQRNG